MLTLVDSTVTYRTHVKTRPVHTSLPYQVRLYHRMPRAVGPRRRPQPGAPERPESDLSYRLSRCVRRAHNTVNGRTRSSLSFAVADAPPDALDALRADSS